MHEPLHTNGRSAPSTDRPRGRWGRRVATLLGGALAMTAACDAGSRDARPPAAASAAADSSTIVPAPPPGPIPDSPEGASIRRGQAILAATRDSLPGHVGNALRCTSCHLENGTRPDALPWIGVLARYPQYRDRSGREIDIAERVNGCFARSMNGTPLPVDGPEMAAITAYFAHLSKGVPSGASVVGQAAPAVPRLAADTTHGEQVYATACARCHGAEGAGTPLAPPVWGPDSYNIGAGMARIYTAAAFIRANMPYDAPGTLPVQDAIDVAAYINSFDRPDFAAKANDWPRGGAPPDLPYRVNSAGRR